MTNLVFYDFETCSSNVSYGQIIQAAAILVNDNFQELDRYEGRCRLSPGIIPEAMALIVNKTTPKILKETNLSHYTMIRQLTTKFNLWKNSLRNIVDINDCVKIVKKIIISKNIKKKSINIISKHFYSAEEIVKIIETKLKKKANYDSVFFKKKSFEKYKAFYIKDNSKKSLYLKNIIKRYY